MSAEKYSPSIDGDVVRLAYVENNEINLTDIKHAADALFELVDENERVFTIVDIRAKNLTMTPEAKLFAATDATMIQIRIAEAIVFNSIIMKFVANSYMRFYKAITPTKAFTNEKKALEWFAQFENRHSVYDVA
ncbi:MAG: hypothetical protein HRT71_04205 [Flavobacteriales bacterium]|nr:hypothetical protein [Flavobacteriales bacterium]